MTITVGERIVLHLNQFSRFQDDFDVPLDVSQDGIASALRISRAHAAIELKKLKDAGDATERLAHIKRGKTKRKVYFLTPKGLERAQKVKEFAEREGIEINAFLDLRKCKGSELWSSTDEKFRPILVQACVFRRPFKRAALPETSISLLPEGQNGLVDMPLELRSSIPSYADASALRQYHSFAADYWLRESNYQERLYHLVKAGRLKEAEMLVANKGVLILSGAGPEVQGVVLDLVPSERHRGKVRYVQAEAARRAGKYQKGIELARQMQASRDKVERYHGLLAEGRVLSDLGEYHKAYEAMLRARGMVSEPDPTMECEIAEILTKGCRYDEARAILEPLLAAKAKNGEDTERIFFQLGTVALRTGNGEEAVKLLSKSHGAAKNKDSVQLLKALSEAYGVVGMAEKSAELAARARRLSASA